MSEQGARGWAKPANSRKYHYFNRALTSLCGRWLYNAAEPEDDKDDHPDNCAACRREVAKLRERERATD